MTGLASKGRNRLWVVSELYHPERTSTGRFLTGIAEGLAADREVRVLCAQPTYAARGTLAPRFEVLNGVHVRRCRSSRFDKNSPLGRIANLLTVTCSIGWRALREFRRGDAVIVVTNPPLLPFLVWFAAFLRGTTAILLIHDVYPDVLVATGLIRRDSLLQRLGERITRWLYDRFDRVVVLGRDMHRLVVDRLRGKGAERVCIIPNWGDVDRIRPQAKGTSGILRRLGWEGDRFVVQYLGNIGRTHGIDGLVEVADALKDEPIAFLFVGQGARMRWLQREVAERPLPNSRVIAGCAEEELADYLSACDVALITLLPGMTGVSVPSRLYNVLASGRPVIAAVDADSEIAMTVTESEVGWVVSPGDDSRLRATILELARNPEVVRERGGRARELAEARYTREAVVEAYRRLLDGPEAV